MKEFLLQIIKVFIPIIAFLPIIEIIVRSIPNSYTHKIEIIEKNCDSAEIIILGTSHSYQGINPKLLKKRAINMALPGQGITVDAFIMEQYIKKMPQIKGVVLPIDYQTLYMFDAYGSNDRYMYYKVYYNFEKELFSFDDYEIFHPFSIKMKFDSLIWGKTKYHEDELGFAIRKSISTENAKETIQWQTISNFSNDTVVKNINALHRIAKITSNHNIPLIIITLPTHKSFYTIADSTQNAFTRNEIMKIINISKKNHYLDYFQLPLEDNDFNDATHLNITGAEKFSRILAHDLDSLQIFN